MTEENFDQLLKEMREENVPPEQAAAARERVWQRLEGSGSLACTEFRPDFAAYLEGGLAESRLLLIEDHLARCPACRHAVAEVERGAEVTVGLEVTGGADANGKARVVAMPRRLGSQWSGWTRWAVAAGVVLAALYLGRDPIDRALAPSGSRATVVSVSGDVYRLPQGTLTPGAELFENDVVRTPAGARATLALADGSRVEMNQRTELSLHAAWSGQTVRLGYGDVLIEAAKQRRGHLRVVTRDSIASVKGTVFAVSSATAGSLVSVVEGSVEVSQPGSRSVLGAGDQAASHSALKSVGIEQAISWTEDAEKYYALLAEFIRIEADLAEMPGPGLRTEARLLRYLPAGAQVYFAIPNLHGTIREALSLVKRSTRDSAELDEWWSSEHGQELRKTLDRVQAITPLLGEEVVCVFALDPAAEESDGVIPLLLAEVQAGREDNLRTAISNVAGEEEIYHQIGDGLLLISDSAEHLAAMSAALGGGASSLFAAEIAGRYQGGVSWLAGIDVATLGSDVQGIGEEAEILGVSSMNYLFFEQRSDGNTRGNEATLSFRESRTGMASWLASPGPAGSAEYVSSEAVAVASASVGDARQAFDEILSAVGEDSEFAEELRKFEAETGVNIGLDIADSLGTDVTFAVERPSVPVPGWVVAFEAVNPGALDETARRLVESYNASLDPEQAQLTLSRETVNGRDWQSISTGSEPMTLHWTYDRGYLVASTDRAVAARAIAIRESGSPLIHTAGFQQRFPATSSLHHSGFFWFNTNGVLADLASLVASPAIEKLMGSREPVLVVVDGEAEQIRATSRTRLTSWLLDMLLVGGSVHLNQGADQGANQSGSGVQQAERL